MATSVTITSKPSSRGAPSAVAATAAILIATLCWAYWATIVPLVQQWRTDDNYSVGQLVPLAALYLLWIDRARWRSCRVQTCWWGIVVILAAQGGRFLGLMQLYESGERYALVLTLLGTVLLVAGWEVFKAVKWILLFLFLMVPLPGRIHNLISGPLQAQATSGAVFVLELLGITVGREGQVILLNESVPLNVAEACSGLRMLTAFVVVSATLAYVVNRPRWQKLVLLGSSIPIGILCNTLRLAVTAILFLIADGEFAEAFFHDFAGITMMPLAVLMLAGEMWVMSRLVTPDPPS